MAKDEESDKVSKLSAASARMKKEDQKFQEWCNAMNDFNRDLLADEIADWGRSLERQRALLLQESRELQLLLTDRFKDDDKDPSNGVQKEAEPASDSISISDLNDLSDESDVSEVSDSLNEGHDLNESDSSESDESEGEENDKSEGEENDGNEGEENEGDDNELSDVENDENEGEENEGDDNELSDVENEHP